MIILVVGNDVQRENACAVAPFLAPDPHRFLDLWTLRLTDDAPDFPGHTPPIRPATVAALTRLPVTAADTVVLPQDNGVLQRTVAATARRRGARVVLLPDGVIASARVASDTGPKRWALDRVDAVARAAGVVTGRPGVMGGTRPDLALLWGEKWADHLDGGRGAGPTAVVGCPRMDALATVPPPPDAPRVLVCSQPLLVAPSWALDVAPRWYRRLEEIFDRPDPRLRLRLHPREFQDDRVPAALKEIASRGAMRDDIAGATLMAAPFSTSLLEAAACGRTVVMLPHDDRFAARAKEFAFLAPDWVPAVRWSEISADRLLDCDDVAKRMTDDYLVNVGTASRAAADHLRSR
ncbi:hypothetical protein [Actinomycetospora aeridis]|uniref:CDP-glycerol:poly(Glycerophosphate) glycerophosphotransferase n=1 Tax=Actinomycetospora aeridis TaxID=3129231 RepID=A0ABU8N676_9PSEU